MPRPCRLRSGQCLLTLAAIAAILATTTPATAQTAVPTTTRPAFGISKLPGQTRRPAMQVPQVAEILHDRLAPTTSFTTTGP